MSSFAKAPKPMVTALIALFFFSAVLTVLAFTPPAAQAQTCTQGQTHWRGAGCCSCNVLRKRLYSCNSSGTWSDTGYTQCFYGECCAYPCCV